MAVTLSTTLASSCATTSRTITVTSATGAAVGMLVKMEHEFSTVSSINGTVITLGPRGINGSIVAPHNALSTVEIGLISEFTFIEPSGSDKPIPFYTNGLIYYGGAGAISIPSKSSQIFLNGTGADAMTLVAPGTDIDGLQLTITAAAAHAYTVTTPTSTGFKNTTGTATFGGAIGDSMTIVACKALWLPVATVNCTFA